MKRGAAFNLPYAGMKNSSTAGQAGTWMFGKAEDVGFTHPKPFIEVTCDACICDANKRL